METLTMSRTPKPPRKPPLHLTIQRKLHVNKPREPYQHIIAGARDTARAWWLHATKGWRTEALR
jgi:hypothetical protein